MSEPRVHMRHVRQLRGRGITCMPSIRTWCAANSIDLRQLASEGIPGEDLISMGGHFPLAVLEIARKEAARGQ